MVAAAEFAEVTSNLLYWEIYDPSVKCDLSSVAYRSREGWVLIDPVWLDPQAWPESWQASTPVALLLTNANHARAAAKYRQTWGCPIWASTLAVPELDLTIDQPFVAPTEVVGLQAIPLAGSVIGETAFRSPEGYLFLGDSVINLEQTGLAPLPRKYCLDARQNLESLKTLLDYDFALVSFAHGHPLRQHAKERLREALG